MTTFGPPIAASIHPEDSLRLLEVHQAKYDALIHAAVDAIICISPRGIVRDFNPAAERMFQMAAKDVIGRNVSCLMAEPHRSGHDAYLARYRETGERRVIGIGREVEGRRSDGTIFPIDLSVTEVIAGGEHFFTGILRDISERNAAEMKLRNSNEELERSRREIAAQAAELKELVIRSAHLREAAEIAGRAKSEFLANTSHELRTPLTAILGFAELIADEPQGSDVPEFSQTILKNGRHLLEVLNDILDLARLDSGRSELVAEPFSPRSLVENVLRAFRSKALSQKLSLDSFIAPEVPVTALADGGKIRQILTNLVSNAIKFTRTGGVFVRMLVDPLPNPPQLRVDVVDTGIGMSPEQCKLLFQPFTQLDTSQTRSYGGTGLGLVISRRLAEMLGGSVELSSVPGRGTTFTFWAEFHTVEGPVLPHLVPSLGFLGSPAPLGPGLVGRKVLIVEDNLDNLKLLSHILTHAGAAVDSAVNGQIGVDLVRQKMLNGEGFEAILLDIQMPVMDGYAAAGELRRMGFTGPIVAVTADTTDLARANCLAAGCDEYLTKPVHRHELINVLQRHMLLRQVRAAVVEKPLMWE